MKILLATDEEPGSGGIINFIKVLEEYLTFLGHEVDVKSEVKAKEIYDLIWIHSLSKPESVWKMLSLSYDPLILFHVHDYRYTCLTGTKATGSDFNPCHKVLSLQCFTTHLTKRCSRARNPVKLIGSYLQKKEWHSVLKRLKCTVLSDHLRDELLCAGLSSENILKIPPVFETFEAVKRPKGNSLNILWAGRMVVAKGIDRLIEFLRLHHKWPPQLKLRIVGSGNEQEKIEALIKEQNLTDRVEFTGACDRKQMGVHYAWADALLYTSKWQEPFGMIGPEALSAGLKIYYIEGQMGGAREWLVPYKQYCVGSSSVTELLVNLNHNQHQDIADCGQRPNRERQVAELQEFVSKLSQKISPIAR